MAAKLVQSKHFKDLFIAAIFILIFVKQSFEEMEKEFVLLLTKVKNVATTGLKPMYLTFCNANTGMQYS